MSEFEHLMTLAEARRQSGPVELRADDAQRSAIARRFAIDSVDRLEATLSVDTEGDEIVVAGRLSAQVVQRCVVSDEPVAATIDAPVMVRFVPKQKLEAAEAEAEIELSDAELDVIGYDQGRVDLGDMVTETLALSLDPYPRGPDAERVVKERGILSEGEAGSFGALAGLRDRLGGAPTA